MSGRMTSKYKPRFRRRVLRVITAFLLVMTLAFGPVMPVFATALPEGLTQDRYLVPESELAWEIGPEYLEPFEALALRSVLGEEGSILLSTLGASLGAVGFEGDYALNNPWETVEIVVTFRTPPSVALRLLDDAAGTQGLSPRIAGVSYEAQALMGHANFAEQFGSLPMPLGRNSGFEIFGQHHTLFNGVYMRVPASMVEAIASLPEVFAVTPNITFYAIGMLNDELYQYAVGGDYYCEVVLYLCDEYCEYEEYCKEDYYYCENEEYCEDECPYSEDEEYCEEGYYYSENEEYCEDDCPYNEDEELLCEDGEYCTCDYEYNDCQCMYDDYCDCCEYGDYCECEDDELLDYLNYLIYNIVLTPYMATMRLGDTLRFEVAAYDIEGYLLEDADIVWSKVCMYGEELFSPYAFLFNGLLHLGLESGWPYEEFFIMAACALNPEVYAKAVVTVEPVIVSAEFAPLSSGLSDEFNLGGLELMEMGAVHSMGHTGHGIHVVVLDTGVDYYYHPRFQQFRQSDGSFLGADFIGDRAPGHRFYGSPQETGPWDTANTGVHTSHGTHVAGTVIAMAPDITMSHVRVLGPGGSSVGNSIMLGIEWAYNSGADVMNLSLGARQNISWMPNAYALDMATLAGVFVAVSAGNDGAGGATPITGRGGWFSLLTPSTSSLSMGVGNATAGGRQFEDHPYAVIDGIPAHIRLHGRDPLTPNNVMNMQNNVDFAFFGQIVLPDTLAGNLPNPAGIDAVEVIANDLIAYWGYDLTGYTVITNRGASNFTSMMHFAYFLNADALIIRNNLAQGDVFLVFPGFSATGVTGVDPDIRVPVYSIRNSVADPIFGPFTRQVPMDTPEKGQMSWNAFARTHLDDIINAGSSLGPVGQTFHLKPDIVAPGTQVLSTIPVFMTGDPADPTTWDVDYAYSAFSGTSMSAPAIAGIAATMMNAFPNAEAVEIKARLMQTARDLTGYSGTYSVLQVGAGFVRPLEAVNSTAFAIVEHEVPWLIGGDWGGTGNPGNIVGGTEGWATHDMASLSFGRVEVCEENGGSSEALTINIVGGSGWTHSHAFITPTQTLPTPAGHPGWGHLRFPATGVTLDIQHVGGNEFTVQINHNGTGDAGFAQGYVTFVGGGQTLRIPFGAYIAALAPEPITARPGTGIWRPIISNFLTPPGGLAATGLFDPRSNTTAGFGPFYIAAQSNLSPVSIGFNDVRGITRNIYWHIGPYGSVPGDADVVHFATTANMLANTSMIVANVLRPFLSDAFNIAGQPSLLGTNNGAVLPAGVYSLFPVISHRPGDYHDTDTVLPPMTFVVVDERPLIHFDEDVFIYEDGDTTIIITGRIESFGHDMAILNDVFGAVGLVGLPPTISQSVLFDYSMTWLVIDGASPRSANPDGTFSVAMPISAGPDAGLVPVLMQVREGDGINFVSPPGPIIAGAHLSLVNVAFVAHIDYITYRPSISPHSENFDLANPADIVFDIDWGTGDFAATDITSVTHSGTTLVEDTDWSLYGDVLTIYEGFLVELGLARGDDITLSVSFNNTQNTIINLVVTTATVTSVTVYPASVYVIQGGTHQFYATVAGTNNPSQAVTWDVTGHALATISPTGLLTVRTLVPVGTELTVTATSVFDNSVYGTATATVDAQIFAPQPTPEPSEPMVASRWPARATPAPQATPAPTPQPSLIPVVVSTPAIEDGLDDAAPAIEFILDQPDNDNVYMGVELDTETLEDLIEQGGSIIVRGSLFNVYISNEELGSWDTDGASVITILLHLEEADMSAGLASQILAHDEFNSFFLENLHLFTVLADDNKISANATITVDLAALGLTVAQQIMMAAYVFDYDAQAYVLMPVVVSESGILSFEFSGYGIIGVMIHEMPSMFMRLAINRQEYSLNGVAHASDVAPFIAQNRTMVPLRVIAEALGGTPRWDSANRTAYIYFSDTVLRLPVGVALPDNMGAPELRDSRVFVPMRYVSEMLGGRVRWDGPNQAVYVYLR